MWTISDTKGAPVAGLGGSFTKYLLAQDAIDRYIEDNERKEKQLN
jgi:hypothetical protein